MTEPKPAPQRVKIFIDFWNYELSMKSLEATFKTDWYRIAPALIAEVGRITAPPYGVMNQGTHVYGSYHPVSELPLHKWATSTLTRIPSFSVTFTKRQKKQSGPFCPACHTECRICHSCGNSMLGYGEKGVDTRIATDMVRYAWEDAYDIALLVSADRDFEPVIDLLKAKGKIVIHGAFPPNGMVLSNASWGRLDIPALRAQFSRP